MYDTGSEWVSLDLTAPSATVDSLAATEATISEADIEETFTANKATIEETLTANDAAVENLSVGTSINTQDGFISGMLTEHVGGGTVAVSPGTATATDGRTVIRTEETLEAEVGATGPGGRQAGIALATDQWYALFVIADEDGGNPAAFLVNESQELENPKAVERRVGWIRTDAGGNAIPFIHKEENRWVWEDDLEPLRTGNPPDNTWTNVDLSDFVPPTATGVFLRLLTQGDGTSGGRTFISARDPDISQTTLEAASVSEVNGAYVARTNGVVTVDDQPSVEYKGANMGGALIRVHGWTENRLAQEPFSAAQEPESRISAQATWDMVELFGISGGTMLRGFIDVSGDGEADLVCNIGTGADFAAIDQDDNVLWRTTIDQSKDKPAYYPQLVESEGAIVFGSRNTDTVRCLNVLDGSVRWTYDANGELHAIEQADAGALVGSKGTNGEVVLLDYSDGSVKSGWPVSFQQHEQALGAGDLDGDGQDEFVLNNTSGDIEVRNRDASKLFDISSNHGHVDLHFIGDIDPNNSGNELLTVIDDDNDAGGEGDELVTYDSQGNLLNKYEAAAGGANLAVGDVRPDSGGREIAFGLEGSSQVGLLDSQLNEIWRTTIPSVGGGAGQLAMADIDGDGNLEVLANTGESSSAGFVVLNADGEQVAQRDGWGWDFDPVYTKSNAAVDSKQFVDVDGDGRDEVHASRLGANRTSGREIIRLMEIKPDE